MKTIKAFLLIFLIISMLLSISCAGNGTVGEENQECYVKQNGIASFTAEHQYSGFKLLIDQIDLDAESPLISLTVFNESEKMMSCDPWYIIEKDIDGKWTSCELKEPEFNTREHGVMPQSSTAVDYSFGEFFDVVDRGSYRFRTNFYLDATGSRDKIESVIEFEIVSDDVYVTINEYQVVESTIELDLTWHNDSEHTVYLGDTYSVKKLVDGVWTDCNITADMQDQKLIAVQSGTTVHRHYTPSSDYEIDSYGQYRIYLEYYLNTDRGTEKRHSIIEVTMPFVPVIEY